LVSPFGGCVAPDGAADLRGYGPNSLRTSACLRRIRDQRIPRPGVRGRVSGVTGKILSTVAGSLGVGRCAVRLSVDVIGASVCVAWTTPRGDVSLSISDASVCVLWTAFLGEVLLGSLLAGGSSRGMRRHLGDVVPVDPVLRGGESGETPCSRSGDSRG